MTVYKIRLYIAGESELSTRALQNLERLCQSTLLDCCEYDVVDILQDVEAARRDKVLATPMVVRYDPPPVRKAVGDLSDSKRVLEGLGIIPQPVRDSAQDHQDSKDS